MAGQRELGHGSRWTNEARAHGPVPLLAETQRFNREFHRPARELGVAEAFQGETRAGDRDPPPRDEWSGCSAVLTNIKSQCRVARLTR